MRQYKIEMVVDNNIECFMITFLKDEHEDGILEESKVLITSMFLEDGIDETSIIVKTLSGPPVPKKYLEYVVNEILNDYAKSLEEEAAALAAENVETAYANAQRKETTQELLRK